MGLAEVQHLTVRESRDFVVDLPDEGVEILRSVGRRLAGSTTWWGDDEKPNHPSVVSCIPMTDGQWKVRVSDAIGMIRLPTIQISIEPKIPVSHLLYLFDASGELPRLSPEHAQAMSDDHFWELVMRWFIDELESLLRLGLLRDYEETSDQLTTLRGSVDPVATARLYYAGQLSFDCRFDEFDFDTQANRLLLAATRFVAAAPLRDDLLRVRAARALARFERVGDLRPDDLRWRPDRRAGYYASATSLARNVLQGVGRTISHGSEHVTSFLLRTPEMVENGLRALLARSLHSRRIEKRGRQLEGSSLTLNPDLVFDGGAVVGDVKYKLLAGEWQRPDLYQLVAFAAGFRTTRGILVHFTENAEARLPGLRVGDIDLHAAAWVAREDLEPSSALGDLAEQLERLLSDPSPPVP